MVTLQNMVTSLMNNYTRTSKQHNINNLVTIIKGIVHFEINF